MHDTLIQGCVGVSTLLEAASRAHDVSPSIATDLLERARDEVRHTVDEARLAVWNLRQGNPDQLVDAVSQLARRASLEAGIPVTLETTGEPFPLGGDSERSLVMVIREGVLNALRHAGPTRVAITLAFERESLQVDIKDDGCGFDTAKVPAAGNGHYGLIGMRERVEKLGGRFHLTTSPGQGTLVRLGMSRR
jgi:signal transduction histidine kinase